MAIVVDEGADMIVILTHRAAPQGFLPSNWVWNPRKRRKKKCCPFTSIACHCVVVNNCFSWKESAVDKFRSLKDMELWANHKLALYDVAMSGDFNIMYFFEVCVILRSNYFH